MTHLSVFYNHQIEVTRPELPPLQGQGPMRGEHPDLTYGELFVNFGDCCFTPIRYLCDGSTVTI